MPGIHSRNVSVVTVDDFTSQGPLWDPVLSAYFYTYTPSSPINGTFTPSEPSTPIEWLYFQGRWGDERYPDSDPRQVNFLNLNITWKFETGPTGPLDKELNRTDVCPDVVGRTCTTTSVLPATSGSSIPVTITTTTGGPGSMPTNGTTTTGTASNRTSYSTGGSATSSGLPTPSTITNSAAAVYLQMPNFFLALVIMLLC